MCIFPRSPVEFMKKNFRKNEGVPKFNYGFPRNSGYSRGNYVQSLQRRETSKLFPGISPEIVAGPGQKLQPQPRIRMTQKFAPFARAINASLEVSSPTRLTKSRKKKLTWKTAFPRSAKQKSAIFYAISSNNPTLFHTQTPSDFAKELRALLSKNTFLEENAFPGVNSSGKTSNLPVFQSPWEGEANMLECENKALPLAKFGLSWEIVQK